MHKLECNIQKYGWGRKGKDSLVAIYKAAQDSDFIIENNATYAELWMGEFFISIIITSFKKLNLS